MGFEKRSAQKHACNHRLVRHRLCACERVATGVEAVRIVYELCYITVPYTEVTIVREWPGCRFVLPLKLLAVEILHVLCYAIP